MFDDSIKCGTNHAIFYHAGIPADKFSAPPELHGEPHNPNRRRDPRSRAGQVITSSNHPQESMTGLAFASTRNAKQALCESLSNRAQRRRGHNDVPDPGWQGNNNASIRGRLRSPNHRRR